MPFLVCGEIPIVQKLSERSLLQNCYFFKFYFVRFCNFDFSDEIFNRKCFSRVGDLNAKRYWFFSLSWNFDCSKMPTNCWSFSQLYLIRNQKTQKPLIRSPPSSSQSWSTNIFGIIRFDIVRFRHLLNFYDSPIFPKMLVFSFNPNVISVSIYPTPYSRFVPMNHERKVLHLWRRVPQRKHLFWSLPRYS